MLSPELKERIKRAETVVALTGAGISAESGVPTFRGEEGLWKKFRPEELANFNAFIRNPLLVWEWYSYRKEIISGVEPNPGHYALAEMESYFKNFQVVTQNVDDLHHRAGSRNIIELHGNITGTLCLDCGKKSRDRELNMVEGLPRCSCGGLLRPDVVWFGESLPAMAIEKAFSLSEGCDLFLSIGTSALVYPAASLPGLALGAGAYVVEINKENTVLSSRVHETCQGESGTVLPELFRMIQEVKHGC